MKFSEMNYSRPDLGKLETEFNVLLGKFDAAASAVEQENILSQINELKSEFQTFASIASVRNSIDTTNQYYEAEQDFYPQKSRREPPTTLFAIRQHLNRAPPEPGP